MELPINLFCGNRFTYLLLSLLIFCLQANAQKTISGIVSDESGSSPGVSIIEKGTSNGTVLTLTALIPFQLQMKMLL